MNIAFIGGSGHGASFCVPDQPPVQNKIVAIAPGDQGENLTVLEQKLDKCGVRCRKYEDYHELLQEESPDIVVVDNYYGNHSQIILDALTAGCHVFSEKPLAVTAQQLQQIRQRSQEMGRTVGVMLNYRYSGAFYRAHQLITSGAIGKVRMIHAQKSYKFGKRPDFMTRRDQYCGSLSWVGIHGIDWIFWYGGSRISWVNAVQSASDAPNGVCPETVGSAQFLLENGIIGSLSMDYLNPRGAAKHGDDRVRVTGSEGVLEIRDDCLFLTNAEGIQAFSKLPEEDIFTDFCNHVATGAPCRCTLDETYDTCLAAVLTQQSADMGLRQMPAEL